MTSSTLHRMLASAGILLSGSALAACASAATAGPGAPVSSPGPAASSAAAGYPGYQWRLVSVSHDGKVTPIPPGEAPVMQFSPDGRFLATDSIHAYSGTYRAASDAFTTSNLAVTANGYIGSDPLLLLTINAVGAFVGQLQHARHPVRLTGDQLVVSSGTYALTYHRAGRQANP